MGLSLITIGLLLLVSAAQDTQETLFATVQRDFQGQDSFLQWIVALVMVGAIGYVPKMKGFSVALLSLVLVAIFLKNGTGFFAQLQKVIRGATATAATKAAA
jgi:hypothetical protein